MAIVDNPKTRLIKSSKRFGVQAIRSQLFKSLVIVVVVVAVVVVVVVVEVVAGSF